MKRKNLGTRLMAAGLTWRTASYRLRREHSSRPGFRDS